MAWMKSEGCLTGESLFVGRVLSFRSNRSFDLARLTHIVEGSLLYPKVVDLRVLVIQKHPPPGHMKLNFLPFFFPCAFSMNLHPPLSDGGK